MRNFYRFLLSTSLICAIFSTNIAAAPGDLDKTKRWALIIGIGEYERKDDLNSLRYAVKDANAIRDALVDPQTGTFLDDHVILVTNLTPDKPTRDKIFSSLETFRKELKPDETLLIFFSGHGSTIEETAYLLPYNANLNIPKDTAISLSDWKQRIEAIPAREKIVVLDACHSGGVEKNKGSMGEMTSAFENAISSLKAQVTFSSSQQRQASYEDESFGHGVFTHYLLEALKESGDEDHDGTVTLQEASAYVAQKVRTWGIREGKSQTPFLEPPNLSTDVILSVVKSVEALPQTFGIRIDTAPQGARIFLNGRDTGLTTPQVIPVPGAGAYPIELRRNGYKPSSVGVTVSINQPVPYISETLRPVDPSAPLPSPTTGILLVTPLIDGREAQAEVYIDGKKVGEGTYQNADVPARTYQLEVREPSGLYHPYQETIVVRSGDTTRVNAILKPAFGRLTVTSEPSGASVDVLDLSGTRKAGGGADATLDIPQLASGTYRLNVSKDQYYHPDTRTVTIRDGQTTRESVTLRPRFGKLSLTSEPSGAEVLREGRSAGTTPFTQERMLSGSYTFTLRKDLYLDTTVPIEIQDGQTLNPSITLPPNFGTLVVDYKPGSARVFLNDQMQGNMPLELKLKPDTYMLRVDAGDKYHELKDTPVVINNRQTRRMEGTLERLKGGVNVLSRPPEAEIFLNDQSVGLTPKVLSNLDADDYTLLLKKESYKDYRQTLRIRDGMLPNINVELEKATSALPYRRETTAAPPYRRPVPPIEIPGEGPGARKRSRVWWYVGGTAVVTGVTTGIVYALTRSKTSETTPVTIEITLP